MSPAAASVGAPVRVGLVLGAGGVAGGAFHAGVLAALAEVTGWEPRSAAVIVGTSAGSVAGASLRAGLSAPDMLARAVGRPMSPAGQRLMAAIGPPRPPPAMRAGGSKMRSASEIATTLARAAARPFAARPSALLAGLLPEGSIGTEFIADSIALLHPHGWSSQPLWICAVRRRDGRLVVFGRDAHPDMADAVAASCAIPGFFSPVEIDGDTYIDGGVHSPTNADVLKDSSVQLVIVSAPMSRAGGVRMTNQPVRHWSRLLLDSEALRLRRRGVHVVAFQPTAEDIEVMGMNAMDAARRADIAAQAHQSTLRRLERADTRERLGSIWAR